MSYSETTICVRCVHITLCLLTRYGLPVNFQAMLLQPNKKMMKKLREVLYELYKHLDSSAAAIIDVRTEYTTQSGFQRNVYEEDREA